MTTPETKKQNRKPAAEGRETRAIGTKLEIRMAGGDDDPKTASGYVAMFNNDTDIGGWWIERIAPGAFTKSLKEHDVVALHGHRADRPLGRKSRDTLTLTEDDKGLAFENILPDTSDGRDLSVQLERGDIEGMSFGFVTRKQEWDETVDPPIRTIIEADLFEITYTAFPAYPDTEVGLRSLEQLRSEKREHNKTGAQGRIAEKRARQAQIERGI